MNEEKLSAGLPLDNFKNLPPINPFPLNLLAEGDADKQFYLESNPIDHQEPIQAFLGNHESVSDDALTEPLIKNEVPPKISAACSYWQRLLDGFESPLKLESAHVIPLNHSPRYSHQKLNLGAALSRNIHNFEKLNKITVNVIMQSVWTILLGRYARQNDIVYGTNLSAHVLPIRIKLIDALTIKQLMAQLSELIAINSDYKDCTLSEIQSNHFKGAEKKLFDYILIVKNNATTMSAKDKPIYVSKVDDSTVPQYPLVLMVSTESDIQLNLGYDQKIFSSAAIKQFLIHFKYLLQQVIKHPQRLVNQLSLLSKAQIKDLMLFSEGEKVDFHKDPSLYELFHRQVLTTPDKIAVAFQDTKLTYCEMHDAVLNLASALSNLSGEVVGLYFYQQADMVISILALWKLGCAYLPIDPKSSAKYIEHICTENQVNTILTNRVCFQSISTVVTQATISVLDVNKLINKNKPNNLAQFPTPVIRKDQTAYILYTSGSTGRPKGVAISQASVINLLYGLDTLIQFQADDCFIAVSAYTFDISVTELILPLLKGGATILMSVEQLMNYRLLNKYADEYKHMFIQTTPSVWYNVLNNPGWHINCPLISLACGEALESELASRLLEKSFQVWNGYGPTENTIFSTIYKVKPSNRQSYNIPIGKPLFNTSTYILDQQFKLVPVGFTGELYLGGSGLMQRYIGADAEALNKAKLIANPFKPGELIYKTGDKVCWLPDGNIQYFGRLDDQIKVRGLRTDLNQITSILEAHKFIKKAIVLSQEKQLHNAGLVVYLLLDEKDFLAEHPEIEQYHYHQWETIYNHLYSQSSNDNPTFDTIGWISSYTNEPFSKVDMQEWTSQIINKIMSFSPNNVLELGCGTGLLLFPIAPLCVSYQGADISSRALTHIRTHLQNKLYKNKVTLSQASASSMDLTKRAQYDTIIINSVIQYFPHIYSLFAILQRCVHATMSGGQVFIGDIRSFKHLKHFHASVALHHAAPEETLEKLKRSYSKFLLQEKELLIDPAFFTYFAQCHPRISHVEIQLKAGSCHNELNDYRYDVILHIEKPITQPTQTVCLDWQQEQLTLTTLKRYLTQEDQQTIHLTNIPNQRWLQAHRIVQCFEKDISNVTLTQCSRFFESLNQAAISPAQLKQMADSCNYDVFCLFSTSEKLECFDAVIYLKSCHFPYLGQVNQNGVTVGNWQQYANKPWRRSCDKLIQSILRQYMLDKLPPYMLPSAFILLDEIPITTNGKLNKKALLDYQPVVTTDYQVANTEVEQILVDIWQDTLNMSEIGVKDNFFQLGGHSLSILRVLQAINKRWNLTLELQCLFKNPTIIELAQEVEKVLLENSNKEITPAVLLPIAADNNKVISLVPTATQKSLWFLHQYENNKTNYNIARAFNLQGWLDIQALKKCFTTLIKRHQALRSYYKLLKGSPVLCIKNTLSLPLTIEQVNKEDISRRLTEESNELFDLTDPPLIRAKLFKLSKCEHVLLITMHHLISDGRSLEMMMQELSQCYKAYSNRQPLQLPPLTMQYSELINWINAQNHKEKIVDQLNYWKTKLRGFSDLNMPTDFPRPIQNNYAGDHYYFTFDSHLVDEIRGLGIRNNTTLYMMMLAAFNILLSRYSRQEDIVIGSPFDNRGIGEAENVLGFFVNTIVLRHQLTSEMNFESFLQQVKQNCLEAYANQYVPFDVLVDALKIDRDISYHPIFQIMFVWPFNYEVVKLNLPEVKSKEVVVDTYTAKFDLVCEFIFNDLNNLECRIEFNTNLYKKSTIARMVGHLQQLLRGIINNPKAEIKKLQILTTEEIKQILLEWNTPVALPPVSQKIHQLFAIQANKTPKHTAVIFENTRLTYAELNAQSTRLAYLIQENYKKIINPSHDKPVLIGLCVERSLDTIIGILAILKAGAGYVPLDPQLPASRLKFMIEDAECRLILTQEKIKQQTLRKINNINAHSVLICMDSIEYPSIPAITQLPSLNPKSDLAYVIYTSGTTGQPKGVAQTHRNVQRLFSITDEKFNFNDQDVGVLFHSYAFDFSVWEIGSSLLYGGCLVIPTYAQTRDPELFYQFVIDQQVTVLNQTPSAFQLFIQQDLRHHKKVTTLRYVIFGGEALKVETLSDWWEKYNDDRPQLVNMYGITETTVHTTYKLLQKQDSKLPIANIGKPLADLTAYIVDDDLNLLPIGVPGELLIGNAGLAEYYLNLPQLTQKNFIESPFFTQEIIQKKRALGEEVRLYKSGDLVRRLEDGSLEYIARIDNQVKIRGFRIELGEIETALNKHPDIQQAVAQVIEKDKLKQIRAYYLPINDTSGNKKLIQSDKLMAYLQEHLPNYMWPNALIAVESMPLTTNMKIDFASLAQLSVQNTAENTEVTQSNLTKAEKLLIEIWQETLMLQHLEVTDNFFSMGGDSMSSIRVVYAAKEKGLNFSVSDIFKYQTIRELAKKCDLGQAVKSLQYIAPFSLISQCDQDKALLSDDVEDAYPQAMLQTGMLYYSINDPTALIYHDLFSYYVFTQYNDADFRAAMRMMFYENPILRTSFNLTDFSEPLQLVRHNIEPSIDVYDLEYLSESQQQQQLDAWSTLQKKLPFEYEKPPLLRAAIHKLTKNKFVLNLVVHHAILDGWSLAVFLSKLLKKYELLSNNRQSSINSAVDLNYKIFVALEKQAILSQQQADFWKEELENYHFSRITPWSIGGKKNLMMDLELSISQVLTKRLQSLAQKVQVSLDAILLAAHCKLLSVLIENKDITTGVVFNGRPEVNNIEHTLGLFLNSLPFRVVVTDCSWKDLVLQVFAKKIKLYACRHYPLGKIYQNMGSKQLFDILFNFVNFDIGKDLVQETSSIKVTTRESYDRNNFSLALDVILDQENTQLSCIFKYQTQVYDHAQIEIMGQYYQTILEAMVNDVDASHQYIHLLTPEHTNTILQQWNAVWPDYSQDQTIEKLFEQQVKNLPDKVAVTIAGMSWTYAELNQKANQLARYLLERGVGPGDCVVVYMERNMDLILAVLAIFKVGAVYVPLDSNFPYSRLLAIVHDTASQTILTNTTLMELEEFSFDLRKYCIGLDTLHDALQAFSSENLSKEIRGDDLAYILYTSGSTGKPKGVMIEHHSLLNVLLSLRDKMSLTQNDVFLALTSISFDISLVELCLPIILGASCVVSDHPTAKDPEKIIKTLAENNVTVMQATPTTWRMLFEQGWQNEHNIKILCGGEALPQDLAQKMLKYSKAHLAWNVYGPTETTIWSTICPIDKDHSQLDYYPIGKPLANTQVVILNENLQLSPIAITGELYIGGSGLARGYLNRPELTKDKFRDNLLQQCIDAPLVKHLDIKLYRTGDLAQWMPNGDIVFKGRVDNQIKIRGYRIELGEIEFVLSQHEKIKQCVVATYKDKELEQLHAYLILQAGSHFDNAKELHEYLRKHLHHYMIPDKFLLVENFPININGKIDVKLLSQQNMKDLSLQRPYAEPVTETQRQLAKIWSEIFKIEQISRDDDFFGLGGNSLLTLKLISRVKDSLQVKLALRAVVELATLEKLAAKIDELRDNNPRKTMSDNTIDYTRKIPNPIISLQNKGDKKPLFLIHTVGGSLLYYMQLVKELNPDRPIYGIQDPAIEMSAPLFHSIKEMAEFYVLVIKRYQPVGPYFFAGSSFGTNVVIEIARYLIDHGDSVAFVGMIDGFARYPTELIQDKTVFYKIYQAQMPFLREQLPNVEIPQSLFDLHWHRLQMMGRHTMPDLSDLKLTLFQAIDILDELRSVASEKNLWDEYHLKSLEVHRVPGDHLTMNFKPNVSKLAKILNSCLIEAEKSVLASE